MMGENIKLLTIKQFQELGFLQEANRQFFHPLGLAIALYTDDPGETVMQMNVWDYRDDPEGMFFAPTDEETTSWRKEKAKYVSELKESKEKLRQDLLGSDSTIQQIGLNPKEVK